jgi:hypothetical protein
VFQEVSIHSKILCKLTVIGLKVFTKRLRQQARKTIPRRPVGKNFSLIELNENVRGATMEPILAQLELDPKPTFLTSVGNTSTL